MGRWLNYFLIYTLILIQSVKSQHSDDYMNGDSYDDPLRRTLGLLGRIMNRMAQPGPPTDDQLHFTVNDPPDIRALSTLIRQQRKGSLKSDKIINEELLQRLIPRIKGQTLPPRTPPTTTTKKPKRTTTIKTTIPTTTPTTTTPTTTTTAPTTLTTTTIATTTTTEAIKPTSVKSDSALIVRVKSIDEVQKSLEASAELNDEDAKNAQIVAEALRILLKEEGMNATKATERLREIARSAIEKTSKNKPTEAPEITTTILETTTIADESHSTNMLEATEETTEAPTDTPTTPEEEEVTTEEESTTEAEAETEESEGDTSVEEVTQEPEEGEAVTAEPVAFKQSPVIHIPEAEEEELPTKSQENVEVSFQETGTTTTTRSPVAGQTVYNLNANANSASDPAISSVFTPVNAIVDGFGPLILPLIGYSRQALQSYRAQGANTYQPIEGKPVQLRSLPNGGYGSGVSTWNQAARAAPTQQQSLIPSLKTATNEELIAAFNRASQATSSPRPYSRFVPNQSGFNAYYSQAAQRQNYPSQPSREIIGSTLPTEAPYYGPQIDRHIGQGLLYQDVRHKQKAESKTQALPVENNPDPSYSQGLKKVSAFNGDSGIMLEDPTPKMPVSLASQSEVSDGDFGTGFGGGKKPSASFEEVVKNTEPEQNFGFLG